MGAIELPECEPQVPGARIASALRAEGAAAVVRLGAFNLVASAKREVGAPAIAGGCCGVELQMM